MRPLFTTIAAACLLGAVVLPARAEPPQLFGTVEFRTNSLGALPEWQRTLAQIAQEGATYDACAAADEACPTLGVRAWLRMIRAQSDHAQIEQLRAINQFLNDWRYKPDSLNYGRRDYWATPLEFLARSGDCEDYAIAKYVTLRRLGYADERLRLVVVRDVDRDVAHAVLAVYLDEDVYILDNLSSRVMSQAEVTHYVPYYSINETSRWAHVTPLEMLVSGRAAGVAPSGGPPAAPHARGR